MRYNLESDYLVFTAGVFILDLNLKNQSLKYKTIKTVPSYVCVHMSRACTCVLSQVPLSTGFPRNEYWSELLFPPPGD